jgi:large subunit ribosomal protein L21
MYAVIKSGGKQYRVAPGQTIRLEKVAGEVGAKIELGNILLVENDGNVQVGSPLVANAKIQATVVEHDRAKKILVFKKKRKKQYRRTQGHRQDYTAVRIDNIIV